METTIQNLWDTVRAVLGGKFIAIQFNQERKKKKLKPLNLTSKTYRKGRIHKTQNW